LKTRVSMANIVSHFVLIFPERDETAISSCSCENERRSTLARTNFVCECFLENMYRCFSDLSLKALLHIEGFSLLIGSGKKDYLLTIYL